MRIEFQCTYDDFVEAHVGHDTAQMRRGKPRSLWAGLIAYLVIGAGAVFLTVKHTATADSSSRVTLPAGRILFGRFAVASLPALLYLGVWIWALARTLFVRPPPSWAPRRTGAGVRLFQWLYLLYLVSVGLVCTIVMPRLEGSAATPCSYEFALSLFPWIAIMVILNGYAIVHRRVNVRRSWEGQAYLRRPHTLEASEAGVTVEESLSSHRYAWGHFEGFRETPGLLLLYVSMQGFIMVPKRAFTTGQDLEAFKALLLTHIKDGMLLPVATGFPIAAPPAPPVAPRPVLPVGGAGEGGVHG